MSEDFEPFATAQIQFEPHTGFLGTTPDVVPEPVSAVTLEARAQIDPAGRLVERYWINAHDESAMVGGPQTVAHSFDFRQVSLLLAAVFDCCGRAGAETRVGFGFSAYRNRLARRIDPTLAEGPVHEVLCGVGGLPERGVLIRFSTGDGVSETVATLRGQFPSAALHALASGYRDLVDWRAGVLEAAPEIVAARRAARGGAWQIPPQAAERPSPSGPRR